MNCLLFLETLSSSGSWKIVLSKISSHLTVLVLINFCLILFFLTSNGWNTSSNSSQISKRADGWPAVPHALPSREQSLWGSVMKLCSVFCSEGGRRALHAESSSPEQLGQRGWFSCNFVAVSFRCQVFWACPLGFDRTTYIWVKQSRSNRLIFLSEVEKYVCIRALPSGTVFGW